MRVFVGVEKFGSLYPFSQSSAKEQRIKLPFYPQPSKSMFPIPKDLSIYLGRGGPQIPVFPGGIGLHPSSWHTY